MLDKNKVLDKTSKERELTHPKTHKKLSNDALFFEELFSEMLVISLFHLRFILKMLGTIVLNLIVGDTILLYYIHVSLRKDYLLDSTVLVHCTFVCNIQ